MERRRKKAGHNWGKRGLEERGCERDHNQGREKGVWKQIWVQCSSLGENKEIDFKKKKEKFFTRPREKIF